MEPRIVTAQEIDAIIDTIDFRAALKFMFAALGRGEAVQPAQTLTPFPTVPATSSPISASLPMRKCLAASCPPISSMRRDRLSRPGPC